MSNYSVNRFGSAEPPLLLWIIFFYPFFFVLYQMPVIRQMLGPWTELEASAWHFPASLISLLLLYTWFNRIPEAGAVWRVIWRWGRWLLISAYLWSLVVLLSLHGAVLQRTDHRHFEAMLILLLIDILAMAYLVRSSTVRRVFAEFPPPIDTAAEREATKSKAEERMQFMRSVRLDTPIAQNAEQALLEAHWRAEVERNPNQAAPWIELGVLAYQCGQATQALELMHKASACDPDNPVVLRNLCELYRQKKQVGRAVAYGQSAVSAAPADMIARLNLAQALVDQGSPDQALAQYHRIIECDPHHVQTWLNMAVLLQQQGRKQDAQVALDAVLLIEPGQEQALTLKKHLH